MQVYSLSLLPQASSAIHVTQSMGIQILSAHGEASTIGYCVAFQDMESQTGRQLRIERGMTLVQVIELSGAIVGVGGALAYVPKVLRFLRRSGHFLDDWLGDEDRKVPGIMERLGKLEDVTNDTAVTLDAHVAQDVPGMLAAGEAWGQRLEARLDRLEDPKTDDTHPL